MKGIHRVVRWGNLLCLINIIAAVVALMFLAGCAPQQQGSWPASLQLVPASYYSVKPRYTSSPAPRRDAPARTIRAPEPPRVRVPMGNAPATSSRLDDLEAQAAEISEQLRAMRRQLERKRLPDSTLTPHSQLSRPGQPGRLFRVRS